MKVDIFNTDKKYNIIYADPPWQYKQKQMNFQHYDDGKKYSNDVTEHYPTMSLKELKDLQSKTNRPMKYNKYSVFDLEKKFSDETREHEKDKQTSLCDVS